MNNKVVYISVDKWVTKDDGLTVYKVTLSTDGGKQTTVIQSKLTIETARHIAVGFVHAGYNLIQETTP